MTASENASGVPGTSIYLGVGETLTMEEMLYGLLLRSGNDAAVAIAEHVAGSVEAFAARMNARAAELGADAHFVNPHGLDADGHEASALALARIFRQAMQNGDFRRITGTKKATIPWVGNDFSRVLVQAKTACSPTYAGATGGKTGYTSDAGRCLVFSAEREGMELIGVVLSCPNWFDEAERMLDWGFENYHLEAPLSAGEVACEAAVEGGMAGTVTAVAESGLAAAVGEERDVARGVRLPRRRARAPRKGRGHRHGDPIYRRNARGANGAAGGGGCGKARPMERAQTAAPRAGRCCSQPEICPPFSLVAAGFRAGKLSLRRALVFNRFNLFKTIHRQPSNVGMLFFRRGKERTNCPNKERFGESK